MTTEITPKWTDNLELVRALYAKDSTPAEWDLFLYIAHKYQLDPMVRQIWCVKYGTKPAQIFAGRDGFLAIAHRSGQMNGLSSSVRIEQVPFTVEYKEFGNPRTFSREFQYVARVTVHHKAMAYPVEVEVWEGEYSTGQNLWASKPRTMIVKVGECHALRRAFDISGIYDPAEMGDLPADVVEGETREIPNAAAAPQLPAPTTQPVPRRETVPRREAHLPPATPRQDAPSPIPGGGPPATTPRRELMQLLGQMGHSNEGMPGWIADQAAVAAPDDWPALIQLARVELRRIEDGDSAPDAAEGTV